MAILKTMKQAVPMTFDLDSHGPAWRPAFEAVAATIGGRIVSAQRQARWRPVFWIEVERPGGEVVPVCFRGARTEQGKANTIRHEYDCLRVLEQHGIPVPKIYGYCEKPEGVIMQKVPGRPDLATADSPEAFESVRDQFIETLARIHSLPTGDFEAFGLERLGTPRDLALGDSARGIVYFRARKPRPDPVVEFLIDWCERHVPPDRSECCFVTGDSGQFIFEGDRLTAMLDMELAYLGDPLADLGGLFCRDLTEKMGDLEVAIARYEQLIGRPVDRRVVLYHAIRFALTTPLGTGPLLARPNVAVEYVQYWTWYLVYSRAALELIAYLQSGGLQSSGLQSSGLQSSGVESADLASADRESIDLADPELPTETLSPYAVAHDSLQAKFAAFETSNEFQAYEADGLRRLALYLRQGDRYGADLLAKDLDDAAKLLGHRPPTWQARDEALSELVQSQRGERDAELIAYLVRRLKREEALIAPARRDLVGASMQRLRLD